MRELCATEIRRPLRRQKREGSQGSEDRQAAIDVGSAVALKGVYTMSKLNEEIITVIEALVYRAEHDHTEYSIEDCQDNAYMLDRAEDLVAYFKAMRTVEWCRREKE